MAKVHALRVASAAEAPAPPQPPAQLNLLTGQAEAVVIPLEREFEAEEHRVDEGILLVKNGDGSQLIVSGFGLFLGKKSERLLVRKGKKEVIYEFPLFRLNEVTVASNGVSLSSDLVCELSERGVQLNFLASSGKPYAKLTSPTLTAVVAARREQISALDDSRAVEFARQVVAGKLANQRRLLKYFGKYLKQTDPEAFGRVEAVCRRLKGLAQQVREVTGANIEEARGQLMGLEGVSGRLYWDGVKEIIADRATFLGRVNRGATDEVNSMLNYGYGILYAQVWGAVVTAGLEPFIGFLHVDRPGKPSLVLDLVEEFRQPVVDRAVIAHVNLGVAVKMENGLLDVSTRQALAGKVLERLEAKETYGGRKYQIRSIIQLQARNLAAFLRGERPYKPFAFKW